MKPALTPHSARRPVVDSRESDIRQLAHSLWIEGGCLEGVELDNWLTAKELIRHRHGRIRGHTVRGRHPGTNASTRSPAKS